MVLTRIKKTKNDNQNKFFNNRKNQTRRNKGLERINDKPESFLYDGKDLMDRSIHWFEPLDKNGNPTEKYKFVKCPYGEENRKENLIKIGYSAKYMFKTYELPDNGQLEAIEKIREQFYYHKE